MNPDYEVVVLDQFSISKYVKLETIIDVKRKDLNLTKASNLLRLYLLKEYGGVWTDATVFCKISLSKWLQDYFTTGFFVFRNPGRDRLLSTWFIAAEPGNALIERLYTELFSFFRNNYFSNQNTRFGIWVIQNCYRI